MHSLASGPENLKYLLSGPLQKKSADSWPSAQVAMSLGAHQWTSFGPQCVV
jgi:hypothetical protein